MPQFFSAKVILDLIRFHQYSKTFHNVEYSNYYWKVPKWDTNLGVPPRPLRTPQGPSGVLEIKTKLQKFKKII